MPHKHVPHHRYNPPHIDAISKQSFFGTLLSRTLPRYQGPFSVGIRDIEIAVPHQKFGNFMSKTLGSHGHRSAGLSLHTVLYTVFYPTSQTQSKEKAIWFPNMGQTMDGFLRMARRPPNWFYRALAYPIAAAAVYGTTFPAIPNAPFLPPPPIPQDPNYKWPLVIFSHGVGCGRLMYSAFCGEMASRGYVVCAVEHRDGTCPSSMIVMEDGSSKVVNFACHQDIFWPDFPAHAQPLDDTHLRRVQLSMRLAEIEHVIASMRRISSGHRITTCPLVSCGPGKKPEYDWDKWIGGVDCRKGKIIISGHSLGGSVAILASAQKQRFDFASVIAMDPAIQRIEPWRSEITCPLLVINSEEFMRSDDFSRLEKLYRYTQNGEGIFSIAGSTHPSFSDVFLIVPGIINRLFGLRIKSNLVLTLTVDTTARFLRHGGDGRNGEFNAGVESPPMSPTSPTSANSIPPHRYIHSHTRGGRDQTSPREDMNRSPEMDVRVSTDPKEVNGFGDAMAISAVSPFPVPIRSSPTSSHLTSSTSSSSNPSSPVVGTTEASRAGKPRGLGRECYGDGYGSSSVRGSNPPSESHRRDLGLQPGGVRLVLKEWNSKTLEGSTSGIDVRGPNTSVLSGNRLRVKYSIREDEEGM